MKTIGFIDYYLNEWHADHYPEWIDRISDETGDGFTVKYAWAEKDFAADEWCKTHNVQRCGTIEELCERSDYIVVLAPSDPEKHLEYAEKVFPYGKRTYIDKTFAPDLETAKKIFKCAEKYGVDFFSTSALRYADELNGLDDAVSIVTTGGGSSIEEYVIHQIEIVVKVLKDKAEAIRVEGRNGQYFVSLKFKSGKQATMIYADPLPFSVLCQNAKGEQSFTEIRSEFFMGLIKDFLHFFKTGEKSFDNSETLEVMKIREGVIKGKNALGKWIELEK